MRCSSPHRREGAFWALLLIGAAGCSPADPGSTRPGHIDPQETRQDPPDVGALVLAGQTPGRSLDPSRSPGRPHTGSEDDPRDLVVAIVLDTVRKDRLGVLGDPDDPGYNPLPFLDTLWDQGLLLDEHRSCSNWTLPSMACAFTGQGQTTLDYYGSRNGPDRLDASIPWWPAVLQAQGYVTRAALANGMLSGSLDHGYDGVFWPGQDNSATALVDGALDELERCGPDQDCFLHVQFMDAHLPWDPPQRFLSDLGPEPVRWDEFSDALLEPTGALAVFQDPEELSELSVYASARYNATLHYLDEELGRLWEALPPDATVLLFSDHGEQLGDHGYWNHGWSLHDEEVAGVAAFFGPDIQPGVVRVPTSHEDLLPTLAALRADPPWPEWTGVPAGKQRSAVTGWQCVGMDGECMYLAFAAADTGLKVLVHESMTEESAYQGYDLVSDPWETRDLFYEEAPELWDELVDELAVAHP